MRDIITVMAGIEPVEEILSLIPLVVNGRRLFLTLRKDNEYGGWRVKVDNETSTNCKSSYFLTYFFANRYYNKLVKKYG